MQLIGNSTDTTTFRNFQIDDVSVNSFKISMVNPKSLVKGHFWISIGS